MPRPRNRFTPDLDAIHKAFLPAVSPPPHPAFLQMAWPWVGPFLWTQLEDEAQLKKLAHKNSPRERKRFFKDWMRPDAVAYRRKIAVNLRNVTKHDSLSDVANRATTKQSLAAIYGLCGYASMIGLSPDALSELYSQGATSLHHADMRFQTAVDAALPPANSRHWKEVLERFGETALGSFRSDWPELFGQWISEVLREIERHWKETSKHLFTAMLRGDTPAMSQIVDDARFLIESPTSETSPRQSKKEYSLPTHVLDAFAELLFANGRLPDKGNVNSTKGADSGLLKATLDLMRKSGGIHKNTKTPIRPAGYSDALSAVGLTGLPHRTDR